MERERGRKRREEKEWVRDAFCGHAQTHRPTRGDAHADKASDGRAAQGSAADTRAARAAGSGAPSEGAHWRTAGGLRPPTGGRRRALSDGRGRRARRTGRRLASATGEADERAASKPAREASAT